MQGTIYHINGIPHVRYARTLSEEPIEVVDYWPLPTAMGKVDEGVECYSRGDCWYVETRQFGSRSFRPPDGGKTESVRREENEVPPPKTKLEVRWHNGQWEKNYARKGWK